MHMFIHDIYMHKSKLTNGFSCVDVKGESRNISTYGFEVSFKMETKADTLNILRHIQIIFIPQFWPTRVFLGYPQPEFYIVIMCIWSQCLLLQMI